MNHPVDTTMAQSERTPTPMPLLHALTALRRDPMALLDEMSERQGDLAWFAIWSGRWRCLPTPAGPRRAGDPGAQRNQRPRGSGGRSGCWARGC